MTRALYLHVGLQKTGTSYLQGIMTASQAALAEQGLDLVPSSRRDAFWLMLDVRGRLRPHDPAAASRVLPRLAVTLDAAPGSRALLSEEAIGPATDEQIDRLLAAAGDREVHVVVTCRDLGRQIPSVWQQDLKQGKDTPFPRYLRRLRRTEGTGTGIWRQKDVPALLERWSRHVPADRIHVVTVPPSGSDPELLLRRYCQVLGVDPASLDLTSTGRGNRGLRLEQAEVMRRVNHLIPDELKRRDAFGKVGKRYLSVQILGEADGRPILMPPGSADWCREVSQGYADHLRSGGYDVVGDPDDLMPAPAAFADSRQRVSRAQVADAAVDALAEIIRTRLQQEIAGPATTAAPGLLARVRARLRRKPS